jgi:phosphopantothenoylcysteine decarboxylase
MNTLMWENPLTGRHMRQLAEMTGQVVPADLDVSRLIDWINNHCPKLKIVPPIVKKLACDDTGVGALADRSDILAAVAASRVA